MNNKIFYSIIIIGLAIGLCIYFYPEIKSLTGNMIFKTESKTTMPVASSSTRSSTTSTTPPVPITQATFQSYAQSQPIIKDVPEGAEVLLKLYNFNTGQRQWEKSYIVKKGSVVEGTISTPEVTLTLNSAYLADLNKIGFCATVKKANTNGDLGMEFGISEVTLAWRYRALMKYKECF
jgi:hypothetical protein